MGGGSAAGEGGDGAAGGGDSSDGSGDENSSSENSSGNGTGSDSVSDSKSKEVKGEGDKYLRVKPFVGNPNQGILGGRSQSFGSPPPQTASKHIQIQAGLYATAGGSGNAHLRIWVNQFVTAEDHNTGALTIDSSFDEVVCIADITQENSGAPYFTDRQVIPINFFGSTFNVGYVAQDPSGLTSNPLGITSGSEQIISTNSATNQLYIEYENGISGASLPYYAFIRQIRVIWASGSFKDFDVLLPGESHANVGSNTNHVDYINTVRADGCQGDGVSNNIHTSKSENYITYNGNQHNNYAYVGFFKEVDSNGSIPFPNGYHNNVNWNNYRYYDFSFDSNENPFSFGQSGNQLENFSGEQYYKGIIGNLNNSSNIQSQIPIDYLSTTITGNAYDYAVNQLHLSPFQTINQAFSADIQGFRFSNVHIYSYNTPDCTAAPPQIAFDACLDPSSSDFYQYTTVDCDSNNLASYGGVNYITNPQLATWNDGACCTDCNGLSLQMTANTTGSVSTQGGNDGVIEVTVLDSNGVATGNANYQYVIQALNSQTTLGLGSAGSIIGSGGVANTTWTFGFNTALAQGTSNIPANTAGATTATLTVTVGGNANILVPANTATGAASTGLDPGCYRVYVYDSSANAAGTETPCFTSIDICIADGVGVIGCMDNSAGTNFGVALNYNSNAVIDDGSCQYCHASNGTLIDYNGQVIPIDGEIATSGVNSFITTPTARTNSNDGAVVIQNVSATSSFQNYINSIVNTQGQINADYTLRLYKAASMVDWDNAQTSTTPNDLTNFTAQAAAYNNNNGGWAYTYNTASLGANINYGYFALKIAVSDPDAVVEVEECFQVFYFIIPIQVCVDIITGSFATALTNTSVPPGTQLISDPRLWYSNPSLCNSINTNCCLDPVVTNPSGPCNVNQIVADFYCDPVPQQLVFELQYDNNGSWVTINTNTYTPNNNNAAYIYTYTQGSTITSNSFIDDGFYRVVATSSYPNSADCTRTSATIQIQSPVYGCMDPQGLNYNALATCPDTCTYCIYGCTDSQACNYNPLATCDDGSCVPCIYGCTDPTATNYNLAATIDDGSCLYGVLGCTDSSAYNYNKNCSGNNVIATIDDGCCFYPCSPTSQSASSSYVVGPATGPCVGSNNDGSITVTTSFQSMGVMASQTKTISYYTNAGVLVYSDPTILSSSTGATWTYSLLSTGVYYYVIIDNFGCTETVSFAVGGAGVTCGCTDPNAPNYDSTATVDDGSCLYGGCIDPNASNYDPSAAYDDKSCEYPSVVNPCIPENTNSLIFLLQACIAKNGFQFYNKLVTGQADDCSIMNTWKVILIEYLVSKRGNLCIYNCADSGTGELEALDDCGDKWVTGGPVTGLNDQAYAGSSITTGGGTTITDPALFFVLANQLYAGDVIKMPSGLIYHVVPTAYNCTWGCYNPETSQGMKSGHWEQCVDGMTITSFNDSVNYLDKFNTFVSKFCVDCNIVDENVIRNVKSISPSDRGRSSGLSIDGISGLEI